MAAKNIMKKEHILALCKQILCIIFGSFITAIALNIFVIPHKFLSGGVGGIALIIQYAFGIQAGYFLLAANIPLFILSIKFIDKKFTTLTIIGASSQSLFLILTRDISKYFMVPDFLLSCIYGGVIYGLAFGFVINNHGSLGGLDIVAMILKKKYGLDLGKFYFAINLAIVSIGSLFSGMKTGSAAGLQIALYTLIFMYINSYMLDYVMKGFDKGKLLFIITAKKKEVIEYIQEELNRSSTILYGEGSYSQERKDVIYCVVRQAQLPKIKSMIQATDPNAFISILDTAEVNGRGFKTTLMG